MTSPAQTWDESRNCLQGEWAINKDGSGQGERITHSGSEKSWFKERAKMSLRPGGQEDNISEQAEAGRTFQETGRHDSPS